MSNGYSEHRDQTSEMWAWAVHDGDIGNPGNGTTFVPVPASAFLFSSALLCLGITNRKAKR